MNIIAIWSATVKKLVRKLVLFTILVSGTQVISLPVGSLTIFQMALIITILLALADVVVSRKILNGRYLIFVCLFAISTFIAWLMSTYPSWANSYFLLGLMITIVVFVMPNTFRINDIDLLEKTLIRSQYIVFPFSIYNIIVFYTRGGMPTTIKLLGGMFIELDKNALLRGQASSQVRLMLPYSTPPVLSVVMAICIIILMTNDKLFKPQIRWGLLVAFSVVLFLTGSRTGMVGLSIVLFIMTLNAFKRKKIKRSYVFGGVVVMVFAIIIFFSISDTTYIQKLIKRFMNINLMEDRHFLVPLDGIIIWLSSLKNFTLGIGFGSSIYLQGAHTYLPAYFLNSFVTLLAERGILGLIIAVMLIRLVFSIKKEASNYSSIRSVRYALMTGLFSCMFYEALNCYFLIFIIGICYMVDCHYCRKITNREVIK